MSTEEPAFDLRLTRATGRRMAKLFAECENWSWYQGQHGPWLWYGRTMAEYLASADSRDEAIQFARLLEQAAKVALATSCPNRILMDDLRVIAEQASRIASGLNPIIERMSRPVIARVRDRAATAVRLTHVYVPVDPVRTRELVRRWAADGNDPGRAARCLLSVAIGVLPVPARNRYAEEYGAELWALRDGPAWRRVGYAMRQASRSWVLRRDLRNAGPALWSEWSREQ